VNIGYSKLFNGSVVVLIQMYEGALHWSTPNTIIISLGAHGMHELNSRVPSDGWHEARDFSLHPGIQTDSVATPVSKQMRTENYFTVGKVGET
jgi:hypothetical protein